MKSDTYTASDGSLWHVENVCPPVPFRDHDWHAMHDNWEGEFLHAATRDGVIAQVEQWVEENA